MSSSEYLDVAVGSIDKALLDVAYRSGLNLGVSLKLAIQRANEPFTEILDAHHDNKIASYVSAVDYAESIMRHSNLSPDKFDDAMVFGIKIGLAGIEL